MRLSRVFTLLIVLSVSSNLGLGDPTPSTTTADRLTSVQKGIKDTQTAQAANLKDLERLTKDIQKFNAQKQKAERDIDNKTKEIEKLDQQIAAQKEKKPHPGNTAALERSKREAEQKKKEAEQKLDEAITALTKEDPNHTGANGTNKGLEDKWSDQVATKKNLDEKLVAQQAQAKQLGDRGATETELKARSEVGDHSSPEAQAGQRVKEAEALRQAADKLQDTYPDQAAELRSRANEIDQKVDAVAKAAAEKDLADTHYPVGDHDSSLGDDARKSYGDAVKDLANTDTSFDGKKTGSTVTEQKPESGNAAPANSSGNSTPNNEAANKQAVSEAVNNNEFRKTAQESLNRNGGPGNDAESQRALDYYDGQNQKAYEAKQPYNPPGAELKATDPRPQVSDPVKYSALHKQTNGRMTEAQVRDSGLTMMSPDGKQLPYQGIQNGMHTWGETGGQMYGWKGAQGGSPARMVASSSSPTTPSGTPLASSNARVTAYRPTNTSSQPQPTAARNNNLFSWFFRFFRR